MLSTQVRLCGDLIGSASLIVVSTSNTAASAIQAPLALAIHRLTATRLGAVLQLVLVWASIAIVVGLHTHSVSSAALILVVCLQLEQRPSVLNHLQVINGVEVVFGDIQVLFAAKNHFVLLFGTEFLFRHGSSACHALCSQCFAANFGDLIKFDCANVSTLTVRAPRPNTIDRLSAATGGALLKGIGIRASITIMGSIQANLEVPASPVLVVLGNMLTGSISTPRANTVNWLRATAGCALLVCVLVWTSIAIVSNTGGDLVGSASPVNVISSIMEAVAIHTPVSNTIHWLRATLNCALNLAILMWALLSTQVSHSGDSVSSAALVFMNILEQRPSVLKLGQVINGVEVILWNLQVLVFLEWTRVLLNLRERNQDLLNVLNNIQACKARIRAFSVDIPLALAIHRLTATRLGAVLQLVLVWASIAIVQSGLAHFIQTAALVLMIFLNIVAGIICTPSANAVHWLRATIVGALLKRIRVGTGKTIVGRCNRDLVQSASLVLVLIGIILA